MAYYILKLIITALLIVLISEIGKRYSLAGALLAAIPLVSILAMIWMYIDTQSSQSAVEFSQRIVWLIAPSMTLFIAFPILIKKKQILLFIKIPILWKYKNMMGMIYIAFSSITIKKVYFLKK